MASAWYEQPAAQQAAAAGQYGVVLKLARQAMGLTQAQAGDLVGYSAATISRLESGATRLTDVAVLRRLAAVFAIPTGMFGLTRPATSPGGDQAGMVPTEVGGGGRMQRREILTGFAALTGAVLMPVSALSDQGITAGLDALLFGPPRTGTAPVSMPQLHALLARAQRDFRACRYRQLATSLPDLLRTAEATRDDQPPDAREAAEVAVAEGYTLATDILIKLHENGAAWATADRALRAAAASGDPHALARAKRLAAIVLRRSDHRDQAHTVVLDAAQQLSASTELRQPADTSLYASMLCTTAYTAALTGHRSNAYTMLDEANEVITEHQHAGFGHNDITMYGIGVARALGDFGAAVDYSRQVKLDLLGNAERHARYWEDTALAWWGRGRTDATFAAMLQAERAAPQEVRYRPWAQQLTTNLLASGQTVGLAGLREFATRAGVN